MWELIFRIIFYLLLAISLIGTIITLKCLIYPSEYANLYSRINDMEECKVCIYKLDLKDEIRGPALKYCDDEIMRCFTEIYLLLQQDRKERYGH